MTVGKITKKITRAAKEKAKAKANEVIVEPAKAKLRRGVQNVVDPGNSRARIRPW